jgi:hypothetical protein
MADEGSKGNFVRWQTITINQLTYTINLVLSFSIASLGFQMTLLLGEKFTPTGWQKCVFDLSLLLIVVSVVFGITVVINRLRAFRATMRAARARENETEATIENHRQLYRKLDGRTWWLFWWQIGTFAGGVALIILSLLAFASQKLF